MADNATPAVVEKDTRSLHSDDSAYWFMGGTKPAIRKVSVDQSARWLAEGWKDMWSCPGVSLTYGAVFVAASYLIVFGLNAMGIGSLALPLMAGFMLIGPVAAVGFYEVSRRRAENQPTTLRDAFLTFHRHAPELAVLGLILMLIFMVWALAAMVIFAMFYQSAPPSFGTFLTDILKAPQAPWFLLVGTTVGAVIAIFTFGITAISLPMLIDRNVTVVHALATSVLAVKKNWQVMIGWGAVIVLLTSVGMATFFVGLAFALPLVGHATWHAYKAIVE